MINWRSWWRWSLCVSRLRRNGSSGTRKERSGVHGEQPWKVGPSVYLPVVVGVPVEALVDRIHYCDYFMRAVALDRQIRLGLPTPTLETHPQSYCFYGKGGDELIVTAMTMLTMEVDGVSVVVIQPDSNQECLIGVNVLPCLGFQTKHTMGSS